MFSTPIMLATDGISEAPGDQAWTDPADIASESEDSYALSGTMGMGQNTEALKAKFPIASYIPAGSRIQAVRIWVRARKTLPLVTVEFAHRSRLVKEDLTFEGDNVYSEANPPLVWNKEKLTESFDTFIAGGTWADWGILPQVAGTSPDFTHANSGYGVRFTHGGGVGSVAVQIAWIKLQMWWTNPTGGSPGVSPFSSEGGMCYPVVGRQPCDPTQSLFP